MFAVTSLLVCLQLVCLCWKDSASPIIIKSTEVRPVLNYHIPRVSDKAVFIRESIIYRNRMGQLAPLSLFVGLKNISKGLYKLYLFHS